MACENGAQLAWNLKTQIVFQFLSGAELVAILLNVL
jgi:hypothetical protein